MNKTQLVEYVRTMILNSEAVADNQSAAHFKRVEQGVGYAFDTILGQLGTSREDKAEIESYYVKHYYGQSVREYNGYRYVGVSDDIVPVAGGNGIWYVQPSRDNLSQQQIGVNFARSGRPNLAIFNSLPVGEVLNETLWRLGNVNTSKQIVFEDVGDSPFTDVRKVDFGVVRAFSSYADTEEILMPDSRYDLVVQMVMQQYGEVYNDKTNNNV